MIAVVSSKNKAKKNYFMGLTDKFSTICQNIFKYCIEVFQIPKAVVAAVLHFKSVEYFIVYTHGKQQNNSKFHRDHQKKSFQKEKNPKFIYVIIGITNNILVSNVI